MVGFTLEVKLAINHLHGAEERKIRRLMEMQIKLKIFVGDDAEVDASASDNVKGPGNGEETGCSELRGDYLLFVFFCL